MRSRESRITRIAIVVGALLLVSLGATAGWGCGGKKATPGTTPVPPSSASNNPSSSAAPTPTGTMPETPLAFTATGTGVTRQFPLRDGLAAFQIVYPEDDTISVKLLDSRGVPSHQLLDTRGPLNAKQSAGVAQGDYSLSVTAGGTWTIYVTQPKPAAVPAIPQVFSGRGPGVTGFFQATQSLVNAEITSQGDGHIKVILLDQVGNTTQVISDASSPYEAKIQIRMQTGTVYVLDVEAPGAWKISLQ